MKKNGLTTAVIAGIAGVAGIGSIADAVNLNPDGLGQVLLYPYYTSQGGNDTLLSVVNTSELGKAVKVRILEGRNSREVLDFHLYLSAFDVWTAAIGHHPTLGTGLTTTDRSCTAPDIARGGLGFGQGQVQPLDDGRYFVPFVNFAFAGPAADHPASAAAVLSSLERTREGYIEIIEMANVIPGSPVSGWITHGANGDPGNCLAVNRAWFNGIGALPDGAWLADPSFGLTAPTGQGALFGNAMIVNPARGTVYGYAADALEGFNYLILHDEPGDTNPGLDAVNDDPLSPAFVPGEATAHVFLFGNVLDASYGDRPGGAPFGQIDAVTALYASPRVLNEYYLDDADAVQASSEWVITFPTKRYYVDGQPSLPPPLYPPFVSGAPWAPFASAFTANGACQNVSITLYNREERTETSSGGGFSPRPPGPSPDALCWEAQVISFGQFDNANSGAPSDILGSTYYKNVQPAYEFGWAAVNFLGSPAMRASTEGVIFNGLPVTGFFATNYDNANLDSGTLANYSALFRHRTERSCVADGDVCS